MNPQQEVEIDDINFPSIVLILHLPSKNMNYEKLYFKNHTNASIFVELARCSLRLATSRALDYITKSVSIKGIPR